MAKHHFEVDLGDIELTGEQTKKLDAAVQKAVAGELADIGSTGRLGLFPLDRIPGRFPGLLIRDFGNLDEAQFTHLVNKDFDKINP